MNFSLSKPVWLAGRETEMNLFAGFRATVASPAPREATLIVSAATFYRLFVNGEFKAYGPARGPHGTFRFDEITLELPEGPCVLALEVASYNVPNYYTVNAPGFLQAELVADGAVLAATLADNPPQGVARFEGGVLAHRVRKVPRMSLQRQFMEHYRLSPGTDAWRTGGDFAGVPLEETPAKTYIGRGAPYPDYRLVQPLGLAARGSVTPPAPGYRYDGGEKHWWLAFSHKTGSATFAWDDVDTGAISFAMGATCSPGNIPLPGDTLPLCLGDFAFATFDFGTNLSGFITAEVEVEKPGSLYVVYDEMLENGDVPLHRVGLNNVAEFDFLEAGRYSVSFFEAQTCRYAKVMTGGASCRILRFALREYANPEASRAQFESSDPALGKIFEAARETLRQNSVDCFTDCPSRERAGWLCDSFFTGRANADFTGTPLIERSFIENFLLSDYRGDLPDGVFPMCYPADHVSGSFIPNWAMWFVLELPEYLARSGDRALIDALKPRVLAFAEFLRGYENGDGLLEDLPSWVFIEWSHANELTDGVNYPSNMTYAAMLDAIGTLYGDESFSRRAAAKRAVLVEQSFNGTFFRDHAVRDESGALHPVEDCTETCQYYAFFFGAATEASHPALWATVRDVFGPRRTTLGLLPEIAPANAFIGNYLRFELLSRAGLSAQILEESKGYFLKMADLTGTLWENDTPTASCCHGFASHIGSVLLRDILGIRKVDPVAKTVRIEIPRDVPLEFCRGYRPVGSGTGISVSWRKAGGAIASKVKLPEGWTRL